MATILLIKNITIPGDEDTPPRDLGTVTVTTEGLAWGVPEGTIYQSSWEHLALSLMYMDPSLGNEPAYCATVDQHLERMKLEGDPSHG